MMVTDVIAESPIAEAPAPQGGTVDAPIARILSSRLASWGLVAVVCLLVFFVNLGGPALWDPQEARHAEIAREMLVTGNWITPTLGFRPDHDKPVFFHWLIALSMLGLGTTEAAARLPSAVTACLGVVVTSWWGSRFLNPFTGRLGALLLATTALYAGAGRVAVGDMVFSWWLVAAFFYGSAWVLDGRTRGHPIWPFYALLGLATLTKGPVALVLAFSTFAPFLYRARRLVHLRDLRVRQGMLVLFTVGGSWYVLAAVVDPAYIWEFLWTHNFMRFLNAEVGHPMSPFAYLYLLPGGLLPWSLYMPVVVYWLRSKDADYSPAREFCLLWIGVTFVFFSLSRAKLGSYMLPIYPPLALLIASALVPMLRREPLHRVAELCQRLVFVALALVTFAAPLAGFVAARMYAPEQSNRALLLVMAWPPALLGFRWLRVRRYDLLLAVQYSLVLCLTAGAFALGAPAVHDWNSLKKPAALLSFLPEATRLVVWRTNSLSMLFYAHREPEAVSGASEAAAALADPTPVALVAKQERLDLLRCFLRNEVFVWWAGGRVLVVNQPPPSGAGLQETRLSRAEPAACRGRGQSP
jgi:4-amino-4-deoxy-L-arabinose transferase-like glycosyltransferase